MISDLPTILIWWFFLFGLGAIFFPLARKLFWRFFDQGYLFAKVLALGIASYLVWLLGSFKLLPFIEETLWLVLIAGLIGNILLIRKERSRLAKDKPPFWPLVLEEGLFLVTLVAWSFVRGFQPDIQGLEKFMDFGFVSSILRSQYFPPADIWFAGEPINYYYFGHFVTAFLTKLTGINSAITYNLMIATLFAFTFTLAFSLTGNLIYFSLASKLEAAKSSLQPKLKNLKFVIIGGLLSGLLLSLGANLHPAYYNFKMGVLGKPYCDGALTYWYPNATRYIGYCPDVEDKTIHEFPSYSFIVSDLHGHVSDLPFVFFLLALSLNLFLAIKEGKNLSLKKLFLLSSPLPLILAIMFMTNQWDFPIYLLVIGLIVLIGHWQEYPFKKAFWRTFIWGGLLLLLAVPLILPFQLNFKPIVSGIDFVRARSRFYQLLILWGAPWGLGLCFSIFAFREKLNVFVEKIAAKKLGLNQLPMTTKKTTLSNPFLSDWFVLALFGAATLMIIIPEIIYLKDIYIASYHRANTMFKLTYQSFVMFSLGGSYIFIRLATSLKKSFLKAIFVFGCLFIFGLQLIYPFYSIKGYYGPLKPRSYQGLFGLRFLERAYPGDYQAVLWFNQNVTNQPNILEAVGDSYTDYGRISMATGLPTIQGWLVHEWLWRGGFDEPGRRSTEVQTIYETEDASVAKKILDKYQVKYVVVGKLEKEKYLNLKAEKFYQLGKEVFRSGQTTIFELL